MTDREKVESALINAGIFKYCTVKELTEIACSLIVNGVTIADSPCDLCRYNPPSSGDGKPCTICPACAKEVDKCD